MFCIRCGQPADGTFVLRCVSCGFTHYLNAKIGSSALVVESDRYLVVLRAREPELGKWDLPGGFVDYGEDPATAASREVHEEAGYRAEIGDLLGVWPDHYKEPDGVLWPTINLIYCARLEEGSQSRLGTVMNLDLSEVAEVQWMPLNNPPQETMAFPIQQQGALRKSLSTYRWAGGGKIHE
jgi:8-oxo-dGTP diphosphatase